MCKNKLITLYDGQLSTKKCLPSAKKGTILYMEFEYEIIAVLITDLFWR